MKLKRIMIAAPRSGSGKTVITCALIWALKMKGQQVAVYKCGPDYLDPMFHETVMGVPSRNLDTFFTGHEMTRGLLQKGRTDKDFAVLEGVMGLFDGLGGTREEGSSYDLAKATGTPIVLVVDARGMGRSVIPEIAGFLGYDREHLIRGVILNRMGKAYYERIKPLIQEELRIPVLGYFPDRKDSLMGSRHLGLVMPGEIPDIERRLHGAAETFAETVSLEAVQDIAGQANELFMPDFPAVRVGFGHEEKAGPVIGVAKDEAFCFYYEENLLLLQEYGAKISYFSPLHDDKLPDECDALLFGGGYPELHAGGLSRNTAMLQAVRQAFCRKMPVVAECGGFMYLHSAIIDKDGASCAMAGVIPASCRDQGKLVRFGYVEIKDGKGCFLPEGGRIRGHEFHYFDSTHNGEDCIARKPSTGREYPCIMAGETYWLGFPHLYYPSNPIFAERFVEKAREFRRGRIGG